MFAIMKQRTVTSLYAHLRITVLLRKQYNIVCKGVSPVACPDDCSRSANGD